MLESKYPKLQNTVCLGTTVSDWPLGFGEQTVVISALTVRVVHALS
jgi:hypothetical protein